MSSHNLLLCSICCDRDITLPRLLQFSTPTAATSLRSSPERWGTTFYIHLHLIFFSSSHRLELLLCFSRTTSACWIWWGTSFWPQTLLTTFGFSRTCRRWLMVGLSSWVCTATSLCFCGPGEAEEARIRGPRFNQPSNSTRNQNGIILHMRENMEKEQKKLFPGWLMNFSAQLLLVK